MSNQLKSLYDLIIIGAGPAGLQAAIYLARAEKKVLLLDKGWGKIMLAIECENYFGFPRGISGKHLLERGLEQAKRFGAEFKQEEVLGVKKTINGFEIETSRSKYATQKVLITTGKAIKPILENEKKFIGQGVSYCVDCDGPLFKDKQVGVVGSGNFAASEALDLLVHTKNIIIFTNGNKAKFSKKLVERVKEAKISIIEDKILKLQGRERLEYIVLNRARMKMDGVFMAVGFASSLDFAQALGLQAKGIFLVVDKKQKTSVKGVWAAGDCLEPPFQIAKAVGEATIAALDMISKAAPQY